MHMSDCRVREDLVRLGRGLKDGTWPVVMKRRRHGHACSLPGWSCKPSPVSYFGRCKNTADPHGFGSQSIGSPAELLIARALCVPHLRHVWSLAGVSHSIHVFVIICDLEGSVDAAFAAQLKLLLVSHTIFVCAMM